MEGYIAVGPLAGPKTNARRSDSFVCRMRFMPEVRQAGHRVRRLPPLEYLGCPCATLGALPKMEGHSAIELNGRGGEGSLTSCPQNLCSLVFGLMLQSGCSMHGTWRSENWHCSTNPICNPPSTFGGLFAWCMRDTLHLCMHHKGLHILGGWWP